MFNEKQKKIERLETYIVNLKLELRHRRDAVKENEELKLKNIELTRKCNSTLRKVRKQTKADLYWECMETMKKLNEGTPRDELQPHIAKMAHLQSLLAQSQSPLQSYGSAGLSGLFGNW